MNDFRTSFTTDLNRFLESDSLIHAAWEGGSAATGYLDEWSDIDLCMVCKDDAIEGVISRLEKYLADNYGIKHKFRMPEPNWHGHSQCFYILHNTPPLFYLDVLFIKLSAQNQFLAPDRHGEAQIWFDKKHILNLSHTPEAETLQRGMRAYAMARDMFDIIAIEVRKQIKRGNKIDAIMDYNMLLARFLAPLLNLKYRPAQFDFSLRYANRSYPKEVVSFIEDLMLDVKFDGMENKLENLEKRFYALIDELHDRWG